MGSKPYQSLDTKKPASSLAAKVMSEKHCNTAHVGDIRLSECPQHVRLPRWGQQPLRTLHDLPSIGWNNHRLSSRPLVMPLW